MFFDFLLGIGVGLVGGVTSGLLGVSPGGGLVIFSILLLGVEQHVAQGISLIAQIFPTSISGIRRYREKGGRTPIRWLVLMTVGFLFGGVGGALAAGSVSSTVLQWTYVFYLVVLDALMIFRRPHRPAETAETPSKEIHWLALLIVGIIAGFSSGFLGIGGGLAVTVCLSAWLKVPQHQAQMASLVMAMIPTTVPAAYVYWHEGWSTSWFVIAGVLVGLWSGTDLGARLANRISEPVLRRTLVGFVSAMAIYMAYKAVS
jgi:uncharacterized membrane protein YfcA